MNIEKLKQAEERFFMHYPAGFADPILLEIVKKHKGAKMNKLAQESFTAEQFENPIKIVDSIYKIVSQSSMVSIFEKPKFRDMVKFINDLEKEHLSHGMYEFFYGDQAFGFNMIVGLLKEYKLAKWPIITACPVYFNPSVEVFIKPTTVKNVIKYFELEGLQYSPSPTFEFYKAYREQMNEMKSKVDASLRNDNAAFGGFLMMSMEDSGLI